MNNTNLSEKGAFKSNRKRIFIIVLLIVIGLLLLSIAAFMVYFLVINPIAKFSSSGGRTTYTGKNLYIEETYLEYDKGTEFKNAVSEISFIDQCTVLDFIYHDYACADTVGYGNYPDYYILEVDIQNEFSNAYKNSKESCLHNSKIGDYDILLMKTYKDGTNYDHLYIAFSEQYKRCFIVYRTDTPNADSDHRLIARDCLPDRVCYTIEDFNTIVIGQSTYQDVNKVAPMLEMEITSEGGIYDYPMKNGGSVRITFVFAGENLVVHSIEEID